MKSKKPSKRSIVALIVIIFWVLYAVFTISTQIYGTTEIFSYVNNKRKDVVDHYLDFGTHFLMQGKPKSLIPRLQKAIDLGQFDFFLLKEKDQVLGFYSKTSKNVEDFNQDFKFLNEFQDSGRNITKTIGVFDYKLTLGIQYDLVSYTTTQLDNQKLYYIFNFLMVTLLVFGVVSFLLKDILKLSKILGGSRRHDFTKIKTVSKEAEALLQATKSLEESGQKLRVDNLLLASSLGPAIRHELKSGRTPPYVIDCTVVRVDLNGYTQMVLQKEPQDLIYLLSEYFRQSRDLIERYNGLIYQYVGDEIIFIFKGDNASRRAAACVHSLFEMAMSLTTDGISGGLRLKASMVEGHLNFVKMDQGHSFSGLPLIESVRMLGQVSEKTENTLIVYSDLLPMLKDLCEASTSKTTVFKGFKDESSIVEIKDFSSVSKVVEKMELREIGIYFRSNQNLAHLTRQLTSYIKSDATESFFSLSSGLRGLTVDDDSAAVVNEYTQLLKTCLDKNLNYEQESRILSSVISLSQNVLAKIPADSELAKMLDRCEQAIDPRARANTLVAKAYFELEIPNLLEKIKSASNRLAADAVMIAGQREFNDQLALKVSEFLASGQPKFIASGLFLIATLIEFYGENDMVYLQSNSHLRELAKEIPKFTNHADPMVRIRAQKSQASIERGKYFE